MTAPVYERHGVTVHGGDCLDRLAELGDASVDAVVTDPPYGLSEVGSEKLTTALTAWVNGDRERVPSGVGFMGKEWDAFVPPPAVWDECLRVLKPGGHALVFAGSRTYDLMGLSIRLAGFEIRDGLQWLYGSGFPKSMDVSKALDKVGGVSPYEQSLILRKSRVRNGLTREDVAAAVGCTASSVRNWEEGRARRSGGTVEFITPSAEYRAKLADLLGYTTDERRVCGVSTDRRSDGTVIGLGHSGVQYAVAPATDAAREWEGWGTALKPAAEPIILARKPLESTVARNVLAHGVGGLNIDGCRVHTPGSEGRAYTVKRMKPGATLEATGGSWRPESGEHLPWDEGRTYEGRTKDGRFPANVLLSHSETCTDEGCAEGCPVAELDAQSRDTRAARPSGSHARHATTSIGDGVILGGGSAVTTTGHDGSGASRFFPCFRWEAKAPAAERPRVGGVSHPTVKPVALMRWLVRLVTPPGGLVVDPFAGSGTTGHAARAEGIRAVLIERDPSYLPLIRARLDGHQRSDQPVTPTASGTADDPLDLFDLLDDGRAS